MKQNDKITAMGEAAQDLGDKAYAKARGVAAQALDQVESGVETVKRKAAGARAAIAEGAGSAVETAVEQADAARETLSDVGSRLAETLERAADQGDALKSRVLTSVAQGLTTASDALKQRSVGDLTADVRMLARKHPGVFMAAAAVAGFAAARFIRSSARRVALEDRDPGRGSRV